MKKILVLTLASAIFLVGCSSKPTGPETEVQAVAVAQCLSAKGANMYGAFWCPHCSDQKKMFGSDAEAFIPYNECDPRGENSVTDTCLERKIESYPTWIFSDGTRMTGAIPLHELAEKSGCTGNELQKYMVTPEV